MLTPCEHCGFYLIHDAHCANFDEALDESQYGDGGDPIDAEDALLSFEQWVRPWCNCFDCHADPGYRKPLFSVEHEYGCMVKWLHEKLAREFAAAKVPA